MSTQLDTDSTTDTSTRGLWRVVAGREISVTLRSRGFLISSALLLVGLVATIVISGIVADRDQTSTVAVVDAAGEAIVDDGSAVAERINDNASLDPKTYDDADAAEQAVRDGDVDVALIPTSDGYEVVGDDDVDSTVSQSLEVAVGSTVTAQNAEEQGVDLEQLSAGTAVEQRLLDPDAKDAGLRQIASLIFVILFYVTALGFGMQIAGSVTQEKESRVVELLAAAVPLRVLLWGKVVGFSVLAIGQVLVMSVAGVVTLLATGHRRELEIVAPALGWYVLFFVLGFAALSSFWTAAGSLASRQQDLQQTTAPAQILLFAPYIIAVTAGEGVRTVASMLPIVSTMLMPSRIAEGSVPLWQIGVALLTTVVAAVLLVRVGARIYERTLLRTGNRIGFKEALNA